MFVFIKTKIRYDVLVIILEIQYKNDGSDIWPEPIAPPFITMPDIFNLKYTFRALYQKK